jgi:hypothetical protein
MTALEKSQWSYEYLPYTVTEADGSERELPSYRIHPDDNPELYIAETNEHLPDDIQLGHARLIAAAPELLDALDYFFNIMHDYQSSRRKGYVKHALDKARAAIARATGKGSV